MRFDLKVTLDKNIKEELEYSKSLEQLYMGYNMIKNIYPTEIPEIDFKICESDDIIEHTIITNELPPEILANDMDKISEATLDLFGFLK